MLAEVGRHWSERRRAEDRVGCHLATSLCVWLVEKKLKAGSDIIEKRTKIMSQMKQTRRRCIWTRKAAYDPYPHFQWWDRSIDTLPMLLSVLSLSISAHNYGFQVAMSSRLLTTSRYRDHLRGTTTVRLQPKNDNGRNIMGTTTSCTVKVTRLEVVDCSAGLAESQPSSWEPTSNVSWSCAQFVMKYVRADLRWRRWGKSLVWRNRKKAHQQSIVRETEERPTRGATNWMIARLILAPRWHKSAEVSAAVLACRILEPVKTFRSCLGTRSIALNLL